MSEPRRSFTEEFKREAVQLAQQRGNVAATARDLGVAQSCLNRWKRHLQNQAQHPSSGARVFPGKGNAQDEEVAKLQREKVRLKEEVEILKKAVGIFTSRPQ